MSVDPRPAGEAEDAERLAAFLAGPGARPTAEDRERWRQYARPAASGGATDGERCGATHPHLWSDNACREPVGHDGQHMAYDSQGRPEYVWSSPTEWDWAPDPEPVASQADGELPTCESWQVDADDDGNPDLIEAMREGHRAAVRQLADNALRDALRIHHPIMRSETGPFSGCRCGQVRLGEDVIAHVVGELRRALDGD